MANHHIFTLAGHSQEVCGLEWSPDGRYLASGGNDNMVYVWPGLGEGSIGNESQSLHCWREHQGAVKVRLWCLAELLCNSSWVIVSLCVECSATIIGMPKPNTYYLRESCTKWLGDVFFLFCFLGFGLVPMAVKQSGVWGRHQ